MQPFACQSELAHHGGTSPLPSQSPSTASTAPRTRQLVFVQWHRSASIHSTPADRQHHREHSEPRRAAQRSDVRPAAPRQGPAGRGHEGRQCAGTVRVRPGGGGYDDGRELPTCTSAARLRLSRADRRAAHNPARGGVRSPAATLWQLTKACAAPCTKLVFSLSFMSAVVSDGACVYCSLRPRDARLHHQGRSLHMHAESPRVLKRVWGTGKDRCIYVSTSRRLPIRRCSRCTHSAQCTSTCICSGS